MVNQVDGISQARLWYWAWIAVAVLWATPVAFMAYGRLTEVTHRAREHLIIEHRLWEQDRDYQGTPQTWTRFAARLLTDRQLMQRVRSRYGTLAEQIELDYRRDLSIAQAEAVFVAVAVWGLPLAALYGGGLLAARLRRRRPPPPVAQPARIDDTRYRP